MFSRLNPCTNFDEYKYRSRLYLLDVDSASSCRENKLEEVKNGMKVCKKNSTFLKLRI